MAVISKRMKYLISILFLCACALSVSAQRGDFPFGKVSLEELTMTEYQKDTSAAAVVLQEFGKARINHEVNVHFQYHVRIKILKSEGLHQATFEIPLYKDGNYYNNAERWVSMQASTYNIENGIIKETPFVMKNLFFEKTNKYVNYAKFALPEVRVGSVIELTYETESPHLFNFHNWEFQSDIPKLYSEFWAETPANFNYNIILRGNQKLKINKSERITGCFNFPGYSGKSDYTLSKYGMEHIPAFIEEEYMTAKKNFLSAIYYELSEFINAQGMSNKYAEEWSDMVKKMEDHDYFGKIIKKSKKLMEDQLASITGGENDPEKKCRLIYDFVRLHYTWNGEIEKYTRDDPKKIFDSRLGSSADINLALIGALQAAGVEVYPLLVSTRDHGLPNTLKPQRTYFNYVVAAVSINNTLITLDATDLFLPFGVLPIRCLNGQGRLLSKSNSQWIDLKPALTFKTSVSLDMSCEESNDFSGVLKLTYDGYEGIRVRKEIASKGNEDFIKDLSGEWQDITLNEYDVSIPDEINEPVNVEMQITFTGYGNTSPNTLYFNPYLIRMHKGNPFKQTNRQYPVDLGAPIEETYTIKLQIPEQLEIEEMPESMASTLPGNGGRFLLNVSNQGGNLLMTGTLRLSRQIYSPQEYPYLKELFNRVVSAQESAFVLKKRS